MIIVEFKDRYVMRGYKQKKTGKEIRHSKEDIMVIDIQDISKRIRDKIKSEHIEYEIEFKFWKAFINEDRLKSFLNEQNKNKDELIKIASADVYNNIDTQSIEYDNRYKYVLNGYLGGYKETIVSNKMTLEDVSSGELSQRLSMMDNLRVSKYMQVLKQSM